MINELLDFSKLKSGKFELKIADFSLEDCINYTASAFSIISLDTKINFNLSYDKAIPAILKGDSLRISQVINNLLNNAFKFTNRGFVYLETKLLHQANNIGWVELKVSDSGIGIPKDRLGKIFDEFYQADTPTPLHTAGTGLGLAISKHLVQIHGGTINVTSKPGSGTTFSVTIPFELGQQKKRLNTGVKKLLLQGKQILICDDNPVNLLIMEKVLSEQGATVTMTKNGKEVLPLLKLKTFDIFLIDLNMPVMNGFELAQELKKKNKAPMLAVTAGNGELLIKKCDRAGFSGIIFKPFSNEELIKQTIECLANKTSLKSKSSETEKLHPINLKKINSIANGNQKTFNELISSITSNLETNIPQLKEAIETGNFKKIRSFTHQLRTIYGYLDLKNELQSVITIEALSEQKKNIAKIRLLFNPLYQQHNQLKSELISLLN